MEAATLEPMDDLVATDDLNYFSDTEDLFSASLAPAFNSVRLNQTINYSAHRALQVCNAQAQLLLAKYQTDNVEDMKVARVKAEHIAYDLGDAEYEPHQSRDNPFEEAILAKAWQAGYESAREARRFRPMVQIEKKYWEEGVNTEDARSQYELCGLQLFRIASRLAKGDQAERARRLAMEMCRYHEGETPSNQRQQEIDRFMARQAERLATSLDF